MNAPSLAPTCSRVPALPCGESALCPDCAPRVPTLCDTVGPRRSILGAAPQVAASPRRPLRSKRPKLKLGIRRRRRLSRPGAAGGPPTRRLGHRCRSPRTACCGARWTRAT
eukprot:1130647-Rhodomonas_salina.6